MRTLGTCALILAAMMMMSAAGCDDTSNQPLKGAPSDLDSGKAGSAGSGGSGGSTAPPFKPTGPSPVDVLFVIDNSVSMADKQQVMAKMVPDLVHRLANPRCVLDDGTPAADQPEHPAQACPSGSHREFFPAADLHLGVITSSLGSHGSDYCIDIDKDDPGQTRLRNYTQDDKGHLITRGPRTDPNNFTYPEVPTYQNKGFVVWDPTQTASPPGEGDLDVVASNATRLVLGADQVGCGYEAPLEAWYRFLVDPRPPASVTLEGSIGTPATASGLDDKVLAQRAAFLRPDSLLLIVMLTDEDDCSIIDGAMTGDVCDDPVLDADGKPTGTCKSTRLGWPRGYAEGNLHERKSSPDGRVTGTPFPVNYLSALQNNGSAQFHLLGGKPICATDPSSPDCESCYLDQSPDCVQLTDETDAPNVRCWDQKRRFGVDMLYPLRRYIDGLSKTQIYDRDGFLVPNPLFASGRSPESVILTGIVGVPWQDIARDPSNPSEGVRLSGTVDWKLIQGNPFALDASERSQPADPLMRSSTLPRSGTQPITGETIGGLGTWNSVNGHEWKPGTSDLQYACIFDLPEPRDCEGVTSGCDCSAVSQTSENPLCELRTSTGAGDGVSSTTQRSAKAFPTPRVLEVLHGLGSQALVGSICSPNVVDPSRDDFGYRSTVKSMFSVVAGRLGH